jgi:hypothetical protein
MRFGRPGLDGGPALYFQHPLAGFAIVNVISQAGVCLGVPCLEFSKLVVNRFAMQAGIVDFDAALVPHHESVLALLQEFFVRCANRRANRSLFIHFRAPRPGPRTAFAGPGI